MPLAMISTCVFVLMALTGDAVSGSVADELGEEFAPLLALLEVVGDPDESAESRLASEVELVGALREAPPSFLVPIFQSLALPVGEWRDPRIFHSQLAGRRVPFPAISSHYSTESQVLSARLRIWEAATSIVSPVDQRSVVLEGLFDEFETEFQMRQLLAMSRRGWSPGMLERLRGIAIDRQKDTFVRLSAANTILDMQHATEFAEFMKSRYMFVDTLWDERGSDFAFRLSPRLARNFRLIDPERDARVHVLVLDWYQYEQERAQRRRAPVYGGALSRLDGHFNNISGQYRDPRAQISKEQREQRDRLIALRREARETGDDTKLREFKAEVAAQQQAELELRIERIDAWIVGNRDRLEQEAEEYQRERMREKGRTSPKCDG